MISPEHKRVSYYFDPEIGIYTFKKGHPMRPLRVRITHDLVEAYEMLPRMQTFDSSFLDMSDEMLCEFHSEEYIDLLKNINEDNIQVYQDQFNRFGFSADCPFPTNSKFYDFCKLYATGSVHGAQLLNNKQVDIALNWSGGLHHAKRQEASGFCYVNDCVLAILELLKHHNRVLYVDIDVHHGDGVEEAFLLTNRVMTCSFHKGQEFFPGTGKVTDVGFDDGMFHAVNFPLYEGMDDISYEHIFKPVIDTILASFKPDAIVLQGGSDSLAGDKLGCFNLSIHGHGACAKYLRTKGLPMIFLGGGGYTLRNIPRCWTYETSVALGIDLPNELPSFDYSHYFYPENKLQTPVSNMENINTPEYMHDTCNQLIDNIRRIQLYTPEMRAESKFVHDEAIQAVSETMNINKEAQEELSDRERKTMNTGA